MYGHRQQQLPSLRSLDIYSWGTAVARPTSWDITACRHSPSSSASEHPITPATTTGSEDGTEEEEVIVVQTAQDKGPPAKRKLSSKACLPCKVGFGADVTACGSDADIFFDLI